MRRCGHGKVHQSTVKYSPSDQRLITRSYYRRFEDGYRRAQRDHADQPDAWYIRPRNGLVRTRPTISNCPWPRQRAWPTTSTAEAAAEHGIRLEVVKHYEARRGFVLLPRRWVVERSSAWAAQIRGLVRDHESLPESVQGLHLVAFVCLMLKHAAAASS